VLFNSYPFLFAFLPVVLVAFYAIPRQRLRLLFIIGASYYFYAYADWWFPALMAGSTAIGFLAGRLLERVEDDVRRRVVLGVGIALLLSLLGVFKYAGFVGGYGADFVDAITSHDLHGFRSFVNGIVLPIGISFYTFEGISYLVDIYRGTLRAERSLLRYAFFISFFPHLIAGPIVRYGILRPQLDRKHRFDADDFRAGLLLFSLGLAKKTIVADWFAGRADRYLGDPAATGFFTSWAGVIAFGFQIYFDFSAYSDMALGLARMVGIELPWNFDRPYSAASPLEFWRRWHVTLSTWLRDYLYIPLGGNRKGETRRDANLMVTMGLGGLWHGASFNFVVWGLYQGVLLVATHHLRKLPVRVPRPVAIGITFVLVMLGWTFFRLHSAEDIRTVLASMFGVHGLGDFPGRLVVALAAACAYVWTVPEEWRWQLPRFGMVRVASVAVLFVVAVSSIYSSHAFIYFRF
jgi:D-alanyl-lipoteichoic acid acyltransferase DltB (MBOAT superfamily)